MAMRTGTFRQKRLDCVTGKVFTSQGSGVRATYRPPTKSAKFTSNHTVDVATK